MFRFRSCSFLGEVKKSSASEKYRKTEQCFTVKISKKNWQKKTVVQSLMINWKIYQGMITCSMYGRGNSSSQPIWERRCWMNMYQTTFKGHAGASPLGIFFSQKKWSQKSRKTPHVFGLWTFTVFGRKPWQKWGQACTLLQAIHFVHHLYSTWFWVSFCCESLFALHGFLQVQDMHDHCISTFIHSNVSINLI